MNKRGQVTIFILLGLLIIAIIGLVYFLRQPNINITNIIPTRTVSLKDSVNDCLKKTSNEGLTLIGKQGGDTNPNFYLNYCNKETCDQVAYLCFVDENKFTQSLPVPIGLITQATKDIVASEIARGDFFDQPFYIKHRGEIVVVKTFVGDSKIYQIKIRDLNDPLQYVPYEFKFAIKSWVTS